MNVTLFHSGKVILVDANVTFSHVVAVNKSVEGGVEEKNLKKKKKPLTLNYTSALPPKVKPRLD